MRIRILIVLSLLFVMCHKNDINDKIYSKEGYIVGFDPCSHLPNYGFAIITSDLKDTLMTYNLPDSIYVFPSEYFDNYFETGYFPLKARYEFKIHLSYRLAEENEKVYNLCLASINQSEFFKAKQIIIESASKIQ